MVKAGIYLLARLLPVLGGTPTWTVIVTTVGAVTMVGGGILALYQTDLKRMLAFSTVSALGILTMLLGIGTYHALKAMVVFLLAHALYKGALFMVAGAVEHETGTRDVGKLGGLWRAMPVTAAVAALAAVAMAGFGPVLSFIGKELLLAAVLKVRAANTLLVPAAVLGGALFVTVAAIVAIKPFWGRVVPTPKHPHEAPFGMWIGPALLATLGVVFGLAPSLLAEPLITPAVGAVHGALMLVELALWHGLNVPLLLSALSVVTGLALYALWTPLRCATRGLEAAFDYGPTRWYQACLDGLNAVARGQTRLLQSGYLRFYVMTTVIAAMALVVYAYSSRGAFPGLPSGGGLGVTDLVLATLMVLGAFLTARAPSRLSSVAALGVVGYGVALTYILYGAPDLAMTQFMTETLTVILFVLVFYHLPRFTRLSSARARWRDAALASAFGLLMTVLVLAATAIPLDSGLREFYARNSRLLAHGRNVVNVILVDFRALDTLGEITVLGVAALGVLALLKLRPPKEHG
jgi:multicomponent Na+:H+ antiporter subunit A